MSDFNRGDIVFVENPMQVPHGHLELPTHVVLKWYGGLKKVSVVQTEQLATIDKGDVISVIAHLTDADMARVDQALMASLGLEVSA